MEGESAMLTASKTPMGILCQCIPSPQPLASAIFQHSVCFCHSPSLSERISHPLLLQLLTAALLTSPFVPVLFSSHIYSPLPFLFYFSLLSDLIFCGFSGFLPCWTLPTPRLPLSLPTSSLLKVCALSLPTTSSFHPTSVLLICKGGGG